MRAQLIGRIRLVLALDNFGYLDSIRDVCFICCRMPDY